MIPIYRATELAKYLSTTEAELGAIVSAPDQHYQVLNLDDPRKPDRQRQVLSARDPLKILQWRFYNRVLLPHLKPSPYSHGGTKGRSIKTNVEPHRRSSYVAKADISNFYPSIHDSRVYRLFRGRFGFTPEVARICCQLCTYRHHLALGLCTSPFIADQLLIPVDARIGAACASMGLVYTRYVDDVTLSGPFDMSKSGVQKLISRILRENGFVAKREKCDEDRNGKIAITGIRVKRGRLDVTKEYAAELDRQLADIKSLAEDGPFDGPYYTRRQIVGRMQFVKWIRPARERMLRYAHNRVNWSDARKHAIERGYVKTTKRLTLVTDERTSAAYDESIPPWEG